ncbi:MAG: nucleoside monophosphate kinase [Holosporaceae bacterium]|jgi:adenylate kinase|nr:nucleoside monophosphate kinase [Holosporaceae bacterium]
MTSRPVVLILLGAPGSGKGTVAQHLKDKYNMCCVSAGDLLRDEIKKESSIGRDIKPILESGSLVGDDVVNELVEQHLKEIVAVGDGAVVLLDGFPRTVEQAIFLDKVSSKYKGETCVIALDVEDDEIVSRIAHRRICNQCGRVYGPRDGAADICICGGKLVRRKDDEESTVRHRLSAYREKTLPVQQHYAKRLIKICGNRSPEEVARLVEERLQDMGIKKRR